MPSDSQPPPRAWEVFLPNLDLPSQSVSHDILEEVRYVRHLAGDFREDRPAGAQTVGVFCLQCSGALGVLDWWTDGRHFSLQEVVEEDNPDHYTPLGFIPLGPDLPPDVLRVERGVHGPLSGARAWWVTKDGDDLTMNWRCRCGRRSKVAAVLINELVAGQDDHGVVKV